MTSRETGPLSRWDLSAALELMQMDFRTSGTPTYASSKNPTQAALTPRWTLPAKCVLSESARNRRQAP